jgi:hypothetical protein
MVEMFEVETILRAGKITTPGASAPHPCLPMRPALLQFVGKAL